VVFIVTVLLSGFLCRLYLVFARQQAIVDTPNQRSSHTQPTPHGGGVAILLALLIAWVTTGLFVAQWDAAYLLCVGVAVLLMLVGVVDDLRGLAVSVRFALYTFLCLATAGVLLGNSAEAVLSIPSLALNPIVFIMLVMLVALVMLWMLNLFNFMDGIDGIAALQTLLACSVASAIVAQQGGDASYIRFCLLLAACHLGFLIWNWPPAKLFMGDAGSVPTGFLLSALAVIATLEGILVWAVWPILLAVFITDATWTLIWRWATGQAYTQAHRLHAYQRLSRHWDSHVAVDGLLVVFSLVWLTPLAWCAQQWPAFALILVFLAYLPLLLGMAKIRRIE